MDSSSKPFVVYWNNIPSPYMVDRFNVLAARGLFEFEAWFNDRIHQDRSWQVDETEWRFRHRYLPASCVSGVKCHWPLPLLGRRPDVLVSLYAEPAFIAGWIIAKIRGCKTGFRVLRTYDTWVKRNPIKNAIKHILFRLVDAIETPGEDGRRFALSYGASSDAIYVATHTVDLQHFSVGVSQVQVKRDALRDQLGLRGLTYIYVGRLWPGKGLGYLIEAFERVQQKAGTEVSLLLVGDGPEESELRRNCSSRSIRNVVFAGFQQRSDLPRYFALADVFVFPTLGDPYGLVVDEAMACSLPVISTSAAGEIHERVEIGVNGFIVPPADGATLATRMLDCLDSDVRTRMGASSLARVQNHTAERWAEAFERMVQKLLHSDDDEA